MYMRYTLDDVKKSSDRKLFNVVSLFAGGGGSSTGYKLSGGEILLINEFQQIAVDTYLENFPDTKTIVGDIREVKGSDILDITGLGVGELDILDGSPPCPAYSQSGTHKGRGGKEEVEITDIFGTKTKVEVRDTKSHAKWDKERSVYGTKQKIDDLTMEMARLIVELQPKVWVCENVKGMTHDDADLQWKRIINELEHGISPGFYDGTYRIMNAADHGVPQRRQRVFMVGVREDIMDKVGATFLNVNSMVFPDPDKKRPTLRDGIYDLLDDEENMKEAQILCDDMKTKTKYEWMQLMPKDIPVEQTYVAVGDYCYAEMERRYKQDPENNPKPKNSHFQSRRTPWDLPSHTLSETGLQTSLAVHLHPREDRGYTTKEAMRLMTLPEDFKLVGTLNEKLARIGLMVAPMQMKCIADNIYQQFLKEK